MQTRVRMYMLPIICKTEHCKRNLHIEYVCMYNVYVYLRQCDRKYISTLTTPRGTLEANAHALTHLGF